MKNSTIQYSQEKIQDYVKSLLRKSGIIHKTLSNYKGMEEFDENYLRNILYRKIGAQDYENLLKIARFLEARVTENPLNTTNEIFTDIKMTQLIDTAFSSINLDWGSECYNDLEFCSNIENVGIYSVMSATASDCFVFNIFETEDGIESENKNALIFGLLRTGENIKNYCLLATDTGSGDYAEFQLFNSMHQLLSFVREQIFKGEIEIDEKILESMEDVERYYEMLANNIKTMNNSVKAALTNIFY